jgi:hypothetical protein
MDMSRELTRRRILELGVGGGCGLAAGLFPMLAARGGEIAPLASRAPHFAPKAKRAVMFFLTGGLSHVDSFDPKPALAKREGEGMRRGKVIMGSPFTAGRYGRGGTLMTDLFPEINRLADRFSLIRSMHGNHNDHFEATLHMHTGSNGSAMPSMGAWISYGLGSENVNLPSHVVFAQNEPYAGAQVWDSNFLPAYHQGLRIVPGDRPIANLAAPAGTVVAVREEELAFLDEVNGRHLAGRAEDGELAARRHSFGAAARLQKLAPEVFDLSGESDATLADYGVQRGDKKSFAWQTLVARRMLESGVRFVELIDTGASGNWDAHGNIGSHAGLAKKIDRPIAAFVRDLEQRGLLSDTLVIFTTEFGRTADGANKGRDHHSRAFSSWLAGGGVKAGYVHGATDELGMQVVEDPVHVHDFHATILHLLGLDHERLTYRHGGRDFRLTDVHGEVVRGVLA